MRKKGLKKHEHLLMSYEQNDDVRGFTPPSGPPPSFVPLIPHLIPFRHGLLPGTPRKINVEPFEFQLKLKKIGKKSTVNPSLGPTCKCIPVNIERNYVSPSRLPFFLCANMFHVLLVRSEVQLEGVARMRVVQLKNQQETKIRQVYLSPENTPHAKQDSHRTNSQPFSLATGLPLCSTPQRTLGRRQHPPVGPRTSARPDYVNHPPD